MKFTTLTASVLSLATAATACVEVEGKLTTDVTVTLVADLYDNGEHVCGGSWTGNKDSGDIPCSKDGYSLTATASAPVDPIKFHYKNPHGEWTFLSDDPGCSFVNCCSPKVPCSCASCPFSGKAFC